MLNVLRSSIASALLSSSALLSCASQSPTGSDSTGTDSGVESTEPDPAESALEIGRAFVADRAFRRAALEESLLQRDNTYAKDRLAHYAIEGQWEALPVLNPRVAPVVIQQDTWRSSEPSDGAWASELSWDEASLLALGKAAFERWPAQTLPQLSLALDGVNDAADATLLGLWRDADGWVGGLVQADYDGRRALAVTCASCHARPNENGKLVHGAASDIHLSALNSASLGSPWGPGLVDVTADGTDNPVAIPDLRATAHQTRLHWSGNLRNNLASLAVRTETLLITNASSLARPPRELAFALALYVQSLGRQDSETAEASQKSFAVFEQNCTSCHAGSTGEGDWVSSDIVGTNPAAAHSPQRGSGGYRVPSLFRLSERSRFTHEGMPVSLSEFFASERLAEYPGHPFGTDLEPAERALLLAYLKHF